MSRRVGRKAGYYDEAMVSGRRLVAAVPLPMVPWVHQVVSALRDATMARDAAEFRLAGAERELARVVADRDSIRATLIKRLEGDQ